MPLPIKRAARLRVAILLLVVWTLLAWGAARLLIVNANLDRADAIVVLSGSAAYVERTRLAAQLFGEGRAPLIVLTNDNQYGGWSNAHRRNLLFVERAREELKLAGVPAESIETLPQAVSSTYEEALLLRDYASARGLRSIMVVTSAYHSRRSLWTFRHVFKGSGIEVGLEAVAPGQQSPSPFSWWLYPSGWPMVAGEYVKLIYYRMKYR
jgi:uncharacterized SAM-binding protein YcdF (DUF218 family)